MSNPMDGFDYEATRRHAENMRPHFDRQEREMNARAGAYWLGMLGFALAVPCALDWAADVAFDTRWKEDDDVTLRHPANVRNEIARAIRTGDEDPYR